MSNAPETASAKGSAPIAPREGEGKYLTFHLGPEEFGIGILKVREIVGLMEITAVPLTALHIRGVINLRGKIIPVVDMRKKFGLPEAAATRETCIITVMVDGKEGPILTGLLVDSVNEVLQVTASEVEPVPILGEDMKLEFVDGISKTKGRVIILLDMNRAMQGQDFTDLHKLGNLMREGQMGPHKEG
jgi:purine-binding chemotaxis protein CheW